jgi:hypothetical protein
MTGCVSLLAEFLYYDAPISPQGAKIFSGARGAGWQSAWSVDAGGGSAALWGRSATRGRLSIGLVSRGRLQLRCSAGQDGFPRRIGNPLSKELLSS